MIIKAIFGMTPEKAANKAAKIREQQAALRGSIQQAVADRVAAIGAMEKEIVEFERIDVS